MGSNFTLSISKSGPRALRDPLALIDSTLTFVILCDTSFTSWENCLKAHADKDVLFLSPGNYTSWGRFIPRNSGASLKRKILSYFHEGQIYPSVNPCENGENATIEGFELRSVSYWTLNSIMIEGMNTKRIGLLGGGTNTIRNNADYNLIYNCGFRNTASNSAIEILSSNHNVIENNILIQDLKYNTDNVAVLIAAYDNQISSFNKVVFNKIVNWNDGIQLLRQDAPKAARYVGKTGELPGTFISCNDIYIVDSLYTVKGNDTLACAENGLDIKIGTSSEDIEDRIIISHNVIHNFRYSDISCGPSGSGGEAIVIHRSAKNIDIRENIIYNCPIGIAIYSFNPALPNETIENVIIERNLLFDINRSSSLKNSGVAIVVGGPTYLDNNLFYNCHIPFSIIHPKAKSKISNNTFVDMEKFLTWEKWQGNREEYFIGNNFYDTDRKMTRDLHVFRREMNRIPRALTN